MSAIYRQLMRPLLFWLTKNDPEYAHDLTLRLLQYSGNSPLLRLISNGGWSASKMWGMHPHPCPPSSAARLERKLWGLNFANPIGLAAGFDKNAQAIPALAALGFGFIEVGTVTLRPQAGQPTPRLFRLPVSTAIINRMGFNNIGALALRSRLQAVWPAPVPIGLSIGKNKDTTDAEAYDDYCQVLRMLYPYFDYLAVNVSSPNTPGLRNLQQLSALDSLLTALQQTLQDLTSKEGGDGTPTPPYSVGVIKPLLVKIAPDLPDPAIMELLTVVMNHNIAGIIATNTTLNRDGIAACEQAKAKQAGGLSGSPLTARSLAVVRLIHQATDGHLPIIGVGGIMTVDDAMRMFDAGASLIQLYSGLVYSGIGLVRSIKRALVQSP